MNILNRKKRIIFLFAGFIIALILVGSLTSVTVQASIEDAMKDLGCNTLKSCDAFCDLDENNSSSKCNAYFVFQEQRSDLENFMTYRLDYCLTTEKCNTYCETHGDLDCREYYGLQNNTAGLEKLINKMRKAEQAWLAGGGPGGCSNKYSCRLYCATHYEECEAFTIDGFEARHAQPVAFHYGIQSVVSLKTALENKNPLPKACQPDYVNGHVGCLSYCGDSVAPDCIRYMKDIVFLSPTDAALLDLKVQGKTPGAGNPRYNNGCSTLQSCETYCDERSHVNECLVFAEKYGLIVTPKELTIYRKIAPLAVRGLTPTFGEYCGIECVCTSVQACRAACDQPENYTQCAEIADELNLIEDVPSEKKAVFAAMEKGESPGQCKDEASCRNYCEDIDHIGECVDFVEKFKLASSDELKEIRQMADVKKAGVAFPGNCKTKESCLKYCDNSANAVVCMEFALKAGFIPKEDAEAVGKILPYLKSGGKLPGGCTTKESCDVYCGSEVHANECADFAVGAGFMTKEEGEILKKTGGKGPGNCKSKEACENYCKDEAHIDECVDFAVKAGFISKEEAEMAKKFKITSGPGGCKNKADCEAFCVVNQDTCFEWAKEHGMLSEQDLKNIEEQKRFMGSLDQAPPEWLACMEKELGPAFFGRFKAGKLTGEEAKSPTLETAQRKCESLMGPDFTECLAKTTCDEFFSCLNPGGSQSSQSGQGGERQGEQGRTPPDLQKRMDSCQEELKEIKTKEVQAKMDACLSRSCSEFDACLKSVQQSQSGEQQGGQQSSQPQDQNAPDPAITAKAQSCQKEKVNACLAKPCGEFQACLNSLGGGGDGGGEQQQGTPDPAVQAKFQSCQPKDGGGDQSGIPQGYSSWQEFCTANYGDSRCAR